MQYSTRKPYDFKAGGRGFDLLRMKIFSERYNFKLQMASKPCRFDKQNEYPCPGNIEDCEYATAPEDCDRSGGTTVTVQFPAADRVEKADE